MQLLGQNVMAPQFQIVITSVNLFTMAKNGKTGDGHRNGQVKDRSQTYNPKSGNWVKRDTDTGKFMDGKSDDKPFKGIRKEN